MVLRTINLKIDIRHRSQKIVCADDIVVNKSLKSLEIVSGILNRISLSVSRLTLSTWPSLILHYIVIQFVKVVLCSNLFQVPHEKRLPANRFVYYLSE